MNQTNCGSCSLYRVLHIYDFIIRQIHIQLISYRTDKVYISYQVESSDQEGAVPVLAVYQLPDGRQGRGMLNNDRSASGTVAWSALFPTDCTVSGEVSLAFYDSQRGEMESLSAVSFQYEYTPPEPEPTEPSEEPPVILPEG